MVLLSRKHFARGFALPTVVVASVVLFAVLVATLSLVTSTRTSLDTQYYESLANDAAESGMTHALTCLQANAYQPQWTDATPLRPGTNCAGVATCVATNTCNLTTTSTYKTSYTVKFVKNSATSITVTSTGTTSLIRKSTGAVWRTHTKTEKSDTAVGRDAILSKSHNIGTSAACFIVANGDLYCAGFDNAKQLAGAGNANNPVKIALPAPAVAVEVSAFPTYVNSATNDASGGYVCAILQDGRVMCWGRGSNYLSDKGVPMYTVPFASDVPKEMTFPSGVKIAQMSLGAGSACFTSTDGDVYCAGYDTSRVLTGLGDSAVPVKIGLPAQARKVSVSPAGIDFIYTVFSEKEGYACALLVTGRAMCWGGGVGYTSYVNSFDPNRAAFASVMPKEVAMPSDTSVSDLVIGSSTACFRTSDDRLYCMGDNVSGEFGIAYGGGTATPVAISLPNKIKQVAISPAAHGSMGVGYGANNKSTFLCALLVDNSIYCWGSGYNQQSEMMTAGSMPFWTNYAPKKINIPASDTSTVVDMSVGTGNVCAVTQAGNVYCMGDNNGYQLGAADDFNGQGGFVRVSLSKAAVYVSVSPSGSGLQQDTAYSGSQYMRIYRNQGAYICALLVDRTVSCWGVGSMINSQCHVQCTIPIAMSNPSNPQYIYRITIPHQLIFPSGVVPKDWMDESFGRVETKRY